MKRPGPHFNYILPAILIIGAIAATFGSCAFDALRAVKGESSGNQANPSDLDRRASPPPTVEPERVNVKSEQRNPEVKSIMPRSETASTASIPTPLPTLAKTSASRSEITAKIRVDASQKVTIEIAHSFGKTPPEILTSLKRLILACADREISRSGEGVGELLIEVSWTGKKTLESARLKNSPTYKSKAVMDCLRSRFNPKPAEPTATPRSMAQ